MKSFKFLDLIFPRLFGQHVRDNDSYIDEKGQGILERFISICAEYFDDMVMPDIDNVLDLIDADKTPNKFINYLWEYFGYIPYSYGLLSAGRPLNKDEFEDWIIQKFPVADYRKLLKYSISLYKIRCTEDFYLILGRFYNLRIVLTDPRPGDTPFSNSSSVTYDKVNIIFDYIWDYDAIQDCLECRELQCDVYIPAAILEKLIETNALDRAKLAISHLINKYLPVHVLEFTTETINIHSDEPNPLINLAPQPIV